ncbi:Ferroporti-1, partial [Tuber indicum]
SLSIALHSLSVLSLSASMTTYLLSVHYTLPLITLARTFSSVVELSSTILMPRAISLVSTSSADPLTPLLRVGLLSLSWQFVTLLPVIVSLFLLPTSSPIPASSDPHLTSTFFISLALSRLGMWTYSLIAQTLVQIMVPETQRVEFSGIEVGFTSATEVARWGLTAVRSQPEQIKSVTAIGMAIVSLYAGSYGMWMWRRRPYSILL